MIMEVAARLQFRYPRNMQETTISLILPTYNEAGNVVKAVQCAATALAGIPHEIIVADDDSPDKTWEVAAKAFEGDATVKVIRRTENRGLYPAVIEGFRAASGKYLAVMDADLQHDESILPKLLEAAQQRGVALAIGSRYVDGGGLGQWNAVRKAMSRAGNKTAAIIIGRDIKDLMSGFFLIEKAAFYNILPNLQPKGFKILMDIACRLPKEAKVEEVPFTFRKREVGESKLDSRVAAQFAQALYELSPIGKLNATAFLTLVRGALAFIGAAMALWLAAKFHQDTGASIAIATAVAAAASYPVDWLRANGFGRGGKRGWYGIWGLGVKMAGIVVFLWIALVLGMRSDLRYMAVLFAAVGQTCVESLFYFGIDKARASKPA